MKTTITAIAFLAIMTGGAHAACQVKHGSIADVAANGNASHIETDCASAADVTALQSDVAGLSVTTADHETRITTLESDSASHGAAISALQSENAAQQTSIDDHETRITSAETKNTEQDGRLDANDTKNAEQDARHDTAEAKNTEQDGRLDGHDTTLASHTSTLAIHGTQIGSLETVSAAHEVRLDAHDAILSQHSAAITKLGKNMDKAFEGVAMALAMESPQVDPGKTFGIALNWGNFEGENAFAAAAKLRLDGTWAATGGVGYGINSNTLGARAGIQAQW